MRGLSPEENIALGKESEQTSRAIRNTWKVKEVDPDNGRVVYETPNGDLFQETGSASGRPRLTRLERSRND